MDKMNAVFIRRFHFTRISGIFIFDIRFLSWLFFLSIPDGNAGQRRNFQIEIVSKKFLSKQFARYSTGVIAIVWVESQMDTVKFRDDVNQCQLIFWTGSKALFTIYSNPVLLFFN